MNRKQHMKSKTSRFALRGAAVGLAMIIIGVAATQHAMSDDEKAGSIYEGRPVVNVDEVIFDKDGKRHLFGGDEDYQHFDISTFRLTPPQLEYGLGREAIKALDMPPYAPATSAAPFFEPGMHVLVIKVGDDVRIYPLDMLGSFEVVNDVVGGRAVAAVFCPLANLAGVFDRKIGEVTYSFAASGYTYFDPEIWDSLSTFVLWDRETESLWWPPIGKAVAGPSVDVPFTILEEELWAQTTWEQAIKTYPDARVLAPDWEKKRPPVTVPRQDPPKVERYTGDAPAACIMPRWGKNENLGTGDSRTKWTLKGTGMLEGS